jgi:hypothetical protein
VVGLVAVTAEWLMIATSDPQGARSRRTGGARLSNLWHLVKIDMSKSGSKFRAV